MAEFANFGKKRSYDDFKKQIPQKVQPIFDLIRNYCFSLGENVVEDIRMHRIVFGKSMTFRWFADVEPQESSLVIKIQKDRKITPTTHQIQVDQNLEQIKKILKDSYNAIH